MKINVPLSQKKKKLLDHQTKQSKRKKKEKKNHMRGRGRGGNDRGGRGGRGGNDRGGRGGNFRDEGEVIEVGTFDHLHLDSAAVFRLSSADKLVPLTKTFVYNEKKEKVGTIKDVFGPLDDVYLLVEPNDQSYLKSLKEGTKLFAPKNRMKAEDFFVEANQPKRGGGGGKKRGGGGGRGGRGGGGGRGGSGGRGGRGGGARGGRGGRF